MQKSRRTTPSCRRTWVLPVLLAASTLTAHGAQHAGGEAPKRVVLYIMAQTRAEELATYGYWQAPTPNLDTLAAECVVFDNALAPAPGTPASLVSLLSGALACEHGVLDEQGAVPESLPLVAEAFARNGYQTAVFATDPWLDPARGLTRGFAVTRRNLKLRVDLVRRWLRKMAGDRYFLCIVDDTPRRWNEIDAQQAGRFGKVSDKALERLERVVELHQRLLRSKYGQRRKGSRLKLSRTEQIRATVWELKRLRARFRAAWDASLAQADATLGQVIDVLRKDGHWDDTLLIVTSDHGLDLGEHKTFLAGQSVYQTALRVPLLIHFPAGIASPGRVAQPVSLLDLWPTLAELLELPDLAGLPHGRSLMPLVAGQASAGAPRVVSMRVRRGTYYAPWYQARGHRNVVIIEGMFKGIWNADHDTFELYDLSADPAEQHDLSERMPERVGRMRSVISDELRACLDRYLPRTDELFQKLDPETRRLLEEAGVLEPRSRPATQPASP